MYTIQLVSNGYLYAAANSDTFPGASLLLSRWSLIFPRTASSIDWYTCLLWAIYILHWDLTLSHVLEMLHCQEVDIEEPIHAVRQATLFRSIELRVLDAASDTLVPAHLRKLVRFWGRQSVSLWCRRRRELNVGHAHGHHAERLTRLDLRALLLVGKELAKLDLVGVVELVEIRVLESGLCGVHDVCFWRGRAFRTA